MAARSKVKPASGETSDEGKGPESPWENLSVTALEADLAYFKARLEWIGEPKTINQKAQQDAFKLLVPAINKIINRLKRKAPVKE